MKKRDDAYLQLLLAAVIIFAIGLTFILSDLYKKVGELEHDMIHIKGVKKLPMCSR